MHLSSLSIYDHHAYPLYTEERWRQEPLERYFTLNPDALVLPFVQDSLFFRRSLRDLAEFFGCEPSLEALEEARRQHNYVELARWLFAEANISHLLIEENQSAAHLWTVSSHAEQLPLVVRRVLLLEAELEQMLDHHESASRLLHAFEAHLRELAPRVAAFKSAVAYRSGLDIGKHNLVELERAYSELRRSSPSRQTPRITSKPLLDSMLWVALKVALETGKVVQFHTGYGESSPDIRLANPLGLRAVLEAPELRGLKIVLLHSYPYVREAGLLASHYPGVYLDLGLTIPAGSVHAMRTALHEATHLAPLSKVLFSTSARHSPEMFWIAARWGRRIVAQVMEQAVYNGDLTNDESEWAAQRILSHNAGELYGALANPPTEPVVSLP
ncbi:MAG: amidohydrolase family protein [Meiothermus sp.]|uniref:amidohydrolase family protein n=1 Tax=Meiothermus sp. TaxID=1955249 RepID=UPI0025E7D126|nr:amidohydrolase family protein [Meiothermus sp.]MCS7067242.1 amidohydrolase family protein [Meiothermus sp.]MDW8426101.1 amidohydrolase family protein [Meiothermus sp.]